jgi:hypothetical protein
VRRFVFVSVPARSATRVSDAKRAVERRLRESGMRHTILRPTFFMEVWLGPALGFDAAGRSATIYGSGENPDQLDLARPTWRSSRVRAVDAEATSWWSSAAPRRSPRSRSSACSRRRGRALHRAARARGGAARAGGGRHRPMARTFASFMLAYARGDRIPMDDVLRATRCG